jgi:hypothetical protein
MADELRIDIGQLRRAALTALDHLESSAGKSVVLEKDFFWSIPAEAMYDLDREPTELTVGQLSESWQHIADLDRDPSQGLAFHLVWLAQVLQAIGQDVVR